LGGYAKVSIKSDNIKGPITQSGFATPSGGVDIPFGDSVWALGLFHTPQLRGGEFTVAEVVIPDGLLNDVEDNSLAWRGFAYNKRSGEVYLVQALYAGPVGTNVYDQNGSNVSPHPCLWRMYVIIEGLNGSLEDVSLVIGDRSMSRFYAPEGDRSGKEIPEVSFGKEDVLQGNFFKVASVGTRVSSLSEYVFPKAGKQEFHGLLSGWASGKTGGAYELTDTGDGSKVILLTPYHQANGGKDLLQEVARAVAGYTFGQKALIAFGQFAVPVAPDVLTIGLNSVLQVVLSSMRLATLEDGAGAVSHVSNLTRRFTRELSVSSCVSMKEVE
jgi:hypothetical protein